jgi:AcrR family transcriptional regulator
MTESTKGVRPPKQQRSRDSLERMLQAAEDIALGGSEALTVAEVVRRAGTSRGAYCHRFLDKEALMRALIERSTTRQETEIREQLATVEWGSLPLEEVIWALLQIEQRHYGRYLLLHRTFATFASSNPVVKSRGYRFKKYMENIEIQIIGEAARKAGHRDPETAARVVSRIWQGMHDEAIEWSTCRTSGEDFLPNDVLFAQVAQATIAYIRAGCAEQSFRYPEQANLTAARMPASNPRAGAHSR